MNDRTDTVDTPEADTAAMVPADAAARSAGEAQAPAAVQAQAAPPSYPAVYTSLMAMGILGAAYGLDDDSDAISTVIEPLLPDPVAYRINRALAQGLHGNGKAAEESLQAIIDTNPQDDCTKVVLAVSKMFAGDPEWQTVLENLFATSTDPVARDAATNVLAYLMQSKF